jgi:hypothetical protein
MLKFDFSIYCNIIQIEKVAHTAASFLFLPNRDFVHFFGLIPAAIDLFHKGYFSNNAKRYKRMLIVAPLYVMVKL